MVEHLQQRRVLLRADVEAHDVTHLVPVAVADARVADGVQQRQVLLELVDLDLAAVGDGARAGLVAQRLRQLVHRAPHLRHLVVDVLSLQQLEWTCGRTARDVTQRLMHDSGSCTCVSANTCTFSHG